MRPARSRGGARVVAAASVAGFVAGVVAFGVAFRERWPPLAPGSALRTVLRDRDGQWAAAGRALAVPSDAEDASDSDLEVLASLGYVGGTGVAATTGGVVRHLRGAAWPSRVLTLSAHGPEALLLDLDGTPLHRWRRSATDVWAGFRPTPKRLDNWRRVRPLPDGSILVIWERVGMARLDAASEVLWSQEGRFHHDCDVAPDGRTAVLRSAVVVADAKVPVRAGRRILEDSVVILDTATGAELTRVSVPDALAASPWAPLLADGPDHADVTHTNTVVWLDGSLSDRLPAFAAGNLLLTLRNLDTVAVLDPAARRIVWAATGMWRLPHDARVVEPGRLLVFDNQGLGAFSRVLEFDPVTLARSWSFDGDPENGFDSRFCGASRRLPNGNTLVVESFGGRAFEVTRSGEVVWEFVNPHTDPAAPEFLSVLYDVLRLPEDFGSDWQARTDR